MPVQDPHGKVPLQDLHEICRILRICPASLVPRRSGLPPARVRGGTDRPAQKAAELEILMRTKASSYDLSDPATAVTGG